MDSLTYKELDGYIRAGKFQRAAEGIKKLIEDDMCWDYETVFTLALRTEDADVIQSCSRKCAQFEHFMNPAYAICKACREGDPITAEVIGDKGRIFEVPSRDQIGYYHLAALRETVKQALISEKGTLKGLIDTFGKMNGITAAEFLKRTLENGAANGENLTPVGAAEDLLFGAMGDVIHRCQFRWNRKIFPEPDANLKDLADIIAETGLKPESISINCFYNMLADSESVAKVLEAAEPALPDCFRVSASDLYYKGKTELTYFMQTFKGHLKCVFNEYYDDSEYMREALRKYSREIDFSYNGDIFECEGFYNGCISRQDTEFLRLLAENGLIGKKDIDKMTDACIKNRYYGLYDEYLTLIGEAHP